MKQFLASIFAVLITLTFISPARAEKVTQTLDIGMTFLVDSYYYKQDKEGMARTVSGVRSAGLQKGTTTLEEDLTQTYMTINSRSSLYFIWNDRDRIGFKIVTNLDGENYNLGVLFAYGFWNPTPSVRLQSGKGTTLFSDLDPTTTMGCIGKGAYYDLLNKMYGVGYGNYFSGYNTYLRVEYRLGDMGYLKAGIVDPRVMTSPAAFFNGQNNGAAVDNSTKLPRFELAVPLRFGQVGLYPSVFWQKQTFNNVKAGWDDSVTSYGLSLGVKADFQPVFLMAEVNYGENWANTKDQTYPLKAPDYSTFGSQVASAKVDAAGKIQNSKALGWWLQAGLNLGRVSPSVIVGRQEYSREADAKKDEMKTMMYGVHCPVVITKGIRIIPEIMIYDNGGSNLISGVEYDFGKELLAGIQFEFSF